MGWPKTVDTDISLDDVAVVVADVSGQTKVADLCHAVIGQKDIPGSHVSVDTLTDGRTDGQHSSTPLRHWR